MENNVKSGQQILDDFFENIENIPDVDKDLAKSISNLYYNGRLTDINLKNEFLKLREKNANEN